MASPDPMPRFFPPGLDQSSRLRIVDDCELRVMTYHFKIAPVVFTKNYEVLRPCCIGSSVQRVVKSFCDFKKIDAAFHHIPVNVYFQFFGQRYQPVEDFRHATADCG